MAFATDRWREVERELETDPAPDPIQEVKSATYVAARAEERQQLQHILECEGEFGHAAKIAKCGLHVPLVCTNCGGHKTAETRCKRRWCPSCQWLIQRKRMSRFAGACRLMANPTMLTLTITNSPDPEALRKLRRDWAKFRRRKLVVDKIIGGVAGLEITNIGQGWHPHLHAIIDCKWLSLATPSPHWSDTPDERALKCKHAQMELSRMWAAVTGQDIAIVHIKRCADLGGLSYALKYSVKGSDLIASKDPIGPMLDVIDRSRLVSAFGSLYGRTAEMQDDDRPAACCPCCGEEKALIPLDVLYSITRRDPENQLPSVPFRAGYPNFDRSREA